MTPLESLVDLLHDDAPPLAHSLLLLSAALSGRDEAPTIGTDLLNELADGVEDRSVAGVVQHLFDTQGFRGDVDDYHAPQNSFLDQVLERRLGMPITLSAVVAEVASRVGLRMHLVGMPGHVLVGIDDQADTYIDAFAGTQLDENGVQQRFASIFGPDANLAPKALQPIDTAAVISRVCNNLTRSWTERDPIALNRLLDVRAELPASMREKQMLIGMAEGRGRFDLAARLRTSLDPTDPTIDRLWARLN